MPVKKIFAFCILVVSLLFVTQQFAFVIAKYTVSTITQKTGIILIAEKKSCCSANCTMSCCAKKVNKTSVCEKQSSKKSNKKSKGCSDCNDCSCCTSVYCSAISGQTTFNLVEIKLIIPKKQNTPYIQYPSKSIFLEFWQPPKI